MTTDTRSGSTARAARHAVAAAAAAAAIGAAPMATAASFIDTVLAALPPNSASATYTTPSAPGTTMTVVETGTATMTGSDLFEYEGLWLGSDGTGGRYTFNFNTPISSISFAFIALTTFGGALQETLTGFVTNTASTAVLSGTGGTATWNGSTLVPLEEDSRAVLTFTASLPAGFSSIRFDHLQPDQLQGFIVERIDFTVTAVPEPAPGLLLAAGLLAAVWRLRRAGSGIGTSFPFSRREL